MRLHATRLPMVFEVDSHAHEDDRGSFRRSWCTESFSRARVDFAPRQASLSTNHVAHTLRGIHWQEEPDAEQKLVRCVAGRIWDLALDLRPESPSYLKWYAAELSAEAGNALFLPRGVAHGFLTLAPGTVVEYLIDKLHVPEAAKGALWNDPAFAIDWPFPPAMISDRDRNWPDFPHG